MKVTAVKGMFDYLPNDAKLRDYLQKKILSTYESQGFNRIYTPIVEDIENLEKSDGGENLNLIFKILKRGDKFLNAIDNKQFDNLCDLGLRYDLTLPLTRFFSCHKYELPCPFKVIQIDRVYRAERPQKGRNREFTQCDIDILGSNSINCEIELIDTTARALMNIGIENFIIRINDRKLLKDLLLYFGFLNEDLDSVCITFDKLDKIGIEKIKEELYSKNFSSNAINGFCNFLSNSDISLENLTSILGESQEIKSLKEIIKNIKFLSKDKYEIQFDISLVRGQGYYTGTIFEIESKDFSCSIGGGGRYDNLIGKFLNEDIPAVGFSIGFERIFSILKERNYISNYSKKKIGVLYSSQDFIDSYEFAISLQNEFDTTLFEIPKKFGKLLNKLEEMGFSGYVVPKENCTIKFFDKKGNI